MSIRWKLNLSVLALVGVLVAAMLFCTRAVTDNARQTREFARMRELSQFTADIRTGVYQYLLPPSASGDMTDIAREAWLRQAVEGIGIQSRLAESDRERALWTQVEAAIHELDPIAAVADRRATSGVVADIEHHLRELRSYYDLAQYNSIASIANSSVLAQTATTLAWLLVAMLFLVHLAMIRRWLLVPIRILRASTDVIGQGRLDYRVPLAGTDELGQLARGIDAMADGLAHYQADLVRTRQLSALGELCAHVAHGLRNPLAGIRSTAQLAEARTAGREELQSVFRDLAHEADRMDRRITRLFEFSRPQELQPRPATFAELAATACTQTATLARSRGVVIEVDDRTEDARWSLDCEQLAQGLAEIVANAVYHSRPGAKVVVRGSAGGAAATPADALEIQVIDAGPGMSASTLAKAFDLFFSTRPDGSGMGLALVRRLVERHGGTIRLTSAPGEGTTCTLCVGSPLPGVSPPPRPAIDRRGACGSPEPGLPAPALST